MTNVESGDIETVHHRLTISDRNLKRWTSVFRAIAVGTAALMLAIVYYFLVALLGLNALFSLPAVLVCIIGLPLALIGQVSMAFVGSPGNSMRSLQRRLQIGWLLCVVSWILAAIGIAQGGGILVPISSLFALGSSYLICSGWIGISLAWGVLSGSPLTLQLSRWLNPLLRVFWISACCNIVLLQFAPIFAWVTITTSALTSLGLCVLLTVMAWSLWKSIKRMLEVPRFDDMPMNVSM